MPGCGKTTFGKKLARLLGYDFLDLDSYIEELNTTTVESIFEQEGEPAFRQKEQEALHKTNTLQRTIIATGGGCVSYANNMYWMKQIGLTVYLNAPIALLCDRLMGAKSSRPMLKGLKKEGILEFIAQKLAEREPKYLQADIIIDVPIKSAESLVKHRIKPYLKEA